MDPESSFPYSQAPATDPEMYYQIINGRPNGLVSEPFPKLLLGK